MSTCRADKAPRKIILDVDDTNANTYGAQQLSLFNDYYDEYCYMPMVIFDGMNGKLILPLLRPGRRNKSLNIFGILRRVIGNCPIVRCVRCCNRTETVCPFNKNVDIIRHPNVKNKVF